MSFNGIFRRGLLLRVFFLHRFWQRACVTPCVTRGVNRRGQLRLIAITAHFGRRSPGTGTGAREAGNNLFMQRRFPSRRLKRFSVTGGGGSRGRGGGGEEKDYGEENLRREKSGRRFTHRNVGRLRTAAPPVGTFPRRMFRRGVHTCRNFQPSAAERSCRVHTPRRRERLPSE